MVDFIKTKYSLDFMCLPKTAVNQELIPFNWRGLRFFPINDKGFYRATKDSLIGLGLNNLDIRLTSYGELSISNSLHKLAYNGVNYTDFYRSDLINVVEKVTHILNVPFREFEIVGRLELGLVIDLSNPFELIDTFHSYKGNRAINMLHGNKPYGKKVILSKYQMKLYNPIQKMELKKDSFVPINKSCIRFELVSSASYLRVRGIPVRYVSDLLDEQNYMDVSSLLTKMTSQLNFKVELPNDMDLFDLEAFLLCQHITKEQKRYINKTGQKKTLLRRKKVYNKIINQLGINKVNISSLIAAKTMELAA